MRLPGALAAVMFLLPALARAQAVPEDLLPASTQAYFRWDGVEKHRVSYARTAVGKILQGDMGRFVSSVRSELSRALETAQVADNLLKGAAPDRLKKAFAEAQEFPKLLSLLGQRGFILGAELRRLEPPDTQATLIVPEGAALLPILRGLVALAGTEIKEETVGATGVLHLADNGIHLCAWAEQGHAIITIGSDAAKAALERAHGKTKRLTSHSLFARLAALPEATSSRGFIDFAHLVPLIRPKSKDIAPLLAGLGIDGLKSLTFYSAFHGDATRSIMELEAAGPRGGLNGLFSGKPFRLADIPALPGDLNSWTCSSLDTVSAYDFLFRAVELAGHIYAPDQLPEVRMLSRQINEAMGIDLRNDLLSALDDQMVIYSAPSEGFFFLGVTVLVKVKDGARARKALEAGLKNLGRLAGVDVRIHKRSYRGQELREVAVRQQGVFVVPTFTVYKDWLVLSLFPQPVKGFILRTDGELPRWQPEPRVKAILDKLPERVTSVSVSDPRPGMTQLLALGPPLAGLIKSLVPGSTLEVDTFPNANEVTRHLFPNVSVTTQEGNVYRVESLHSLSGPFDLISVDRIATLYFAATVFRFAF